MSNFTSVYKSKYSNTVTLDQPQYPHLQQTVLFRFLKELPSLDVSGPWVAGGAVWRAVNNQPLDNCDIDIFFPNKEAYEDGCRRMNSLPYVNHVISETKNKFNTLFKYHVSQGKTYNKTIDVQLVGMDYTGSLPQLLEGFDLTVCQFGFDGKSLIAGSDSVNDLTKKQIRIYQIRRPRGMLKHIVKYMNNGFSLDEVNTKFLLSEMAGNTDIWSKKVGEDYDGDKKSVKDDDSNEKWGGDVIDSSWEGFNVAAPFQAQSAPEPAAGDRNRQRRRGIRGDRAEAQVIREVAPIVNDGHWHPGAGVRIDPLAFREGSGADNGRRVDGPVVELRWANNPPPEAVPAPAMPAAPEVQYINPMAQPAAMRFYNEFRLGCNPPQPAQPPAANPAQPDAEGEALLNHILHDIAADPDDDAEEGEWVGFGYSVAQAARQQNNGQNERRP